MKKFFMIIAFLASNLTYAASLPTPSHVEVERYVGKWYAISSLPQIFTIGCVAQTAEYEILSENSVSVLNTCYNLFGWPTTITGEAVVVNPKTNAELVVTFDNFFTRLFNVKGDYTIIKLDPNYEYVMVGSKDRNSLWIMSRETSMPSSVFKQYVKLAASLGFNVNNLVNSEF
jgi:apolipoprotein D and lipocalin family protein